MKINNECCCGYKTEKPDQIKDNCPVCNKEGISVSKVTVEHLVLIHANLILLPIY